MITPAVTVGQSPTHQSISLNGIARISAGENPVPAATLRANAFKVSGLQFILFDQAKITLLQSAIVTLFQAFDIGVFHFRQVCEEMHFRFC